MGVIGGVFRVEMKVEGYAEPSSKGVCFVGGVEEPLHEVALIGVEIRIPKEMRVRGDDGDVVQEGVV